MVDLHNTGHTAHQGLHSSRPKHRVLQDWSGYVLKLEKRQAAREEKRQNIILRPVAQQQGQQRANQEPKLLRLRLAVEEEGEGDGLKPVDGHWPARPLGHGSSLLGGNAVGAIGDLTGLDGDGEADAGSGEGAQQARVNNASGGGSSSSSGESSSSTDHNISSRSGGSSTGSGDGTVIDLTTPTGAVDVRGQGLADERAVRVKVQFFVAPNRPPPRSSKKDRNAVQGVFPYV